MNLLRSPITKIIDDTDSVPFCDERIHDMRSDEPGSARNKKVGHKERRKTRE